MLTACLWGNVPGTAEAAYWMKAVWFPIGCPGKDSQISNHHWCLPKPMTAMLIDVNFPGAWNCFWQKLVKVRDLGLHVQKVKPHILDLFFKLLLMHIVVEALLKLSKWGTNIVHDANAGALTKFLKCLHFAVFYFACQLIFQRGKTKLLIFYVVRNEVP
jgi:hypothetical protein